jgi:macrolide transport system ATP-binding/permease protein
MPVLQLKEVHKEYASADAPVRALRGVSLSIDKGEFVAVMGASGSGKSTLMNVLGCLDQPSSGEYWLDGVLVDQRTRDELAEFRNRKIGFVFQGYNLLSRTTALENVELPMLCGSEHASLQDIQQQALARLAQVGLDYRAGHYPNQLSGGQQQRVAIARALINNPEVIFADEPTGNLDTKTSKEIMGIFQALNDAGVTIVIVTHEPDIAAYCKRRITLRDGEIIEDLLVSERTLAPEPLHPPADQGRQAKPVARESFGAVLNTLPVLKIALRSLRRTMLRSSLSALGVTIGVAAVIALAGIGNGAKAEVEAIYSRISPNLIVFSASMPREFWHNNTSMPVPDGDGFQIEDYEALRANVPGIEHATIMVASNAAEVIAGSVRSEANVTGLDVDGFDMLGHRILSGDGSPFGAQDVRSTAAVALISEYIARTLFGERNALGELIDIQGAPFVVIGVMEDNVPAGAATSGGDINDKSVIVPYTSALERLDPGAAILIVLQAPNVEALEPLQAEAKSLLEERWGTRQAEIYSGNIEQEKREVTQGKQTMTFLLGAMGSIALLVGAIGITNVMVLSVTERTREIGIRLAIGTRSRDILLQFLLEAMIITILGGFAGIAVGIGSTYLITYLNEWPTLITVNVVLSVVVLSAAFGVLSGVLPAKRAAQLDPIIALRSE